jgi:hypothetical protein
MRKEVNMMFGMKMTSELAREIGVQAYRIAYAVQIGALPAAEIVSGRRLWTPEQAEAARRYFEAMKKLPSRGRHVRQPPPPAAAAV